MNNKPNKLPLSRHKNEFCGSVSEGSPGVSRWHPAKAQSSHNNSMSLSCYSASSYLLGRQECDSESSGVEVKATGLSIGI